MISILRLKLILLSSCAFLCLSIFSEDSSEDRIEKIPKVSTVLVKDELLSLTPYVRYFRDTNRQASKETIRQQFDNMSLVTDEQIHFGFQDDAFWFGFYLENPTESERHLYLNISNPLLDSVKTFVYEAGKSTPELTVITGDLEPFSSRAVDHVDFSTPFIAKANTEYLILINVDSRSSLKVPLSLSSAGAFVKKSEEQSVMLGLHFGVLLVMALYNFLIFLSLKDRSYMYLSTTLAFYLLFLVALTGKGYQYLWSASPSWNNISIGLFAFLTLTSFMLFLNALLAVKRTFPQAYWLVKIFIGFCVLFTLLTFFVDYQISVMAAVYSLLVCLVLSFTIGLVVFNRGYKPARLFILGFGALMTGTIIWALTLLGFIDRIMFAEHAIEFGSIFCVSLFSLALADRINGEILEKQKAQLEAINNLEKYKKIYDSSLEGMFRVDEDNNLVTCNSAFAELIGASSEQQLLRDRCNLSQLIPANDDSREIYLSSLAENGYIMGFESQCKKINGDLFWVTIFARKYSNGDEQGIEGSIIDISEKKKSELQLEYLACNDVLTGLLNRSGFEHYLEMALDVVVQTDRKYALLMIDLDQFKIINDTSGHSAGDNLIKEVASLLKSMLREGDRLARLGGDEFSILLENCSISKAAEIGERIRITISKTRFEINGAWLNCSASIGIVPVLGEIGKIEDILSLADTACYAAKDDGRNRVVVHETKTGELFRRKQEMTVVNDVKDAIEENRLILYKQDIFVIDNSRGGDRYEILVRMKSGDDIIPPGLFLPAAERYNTISSVDRWVIEAYFKWLSRHPEEEKKLAQANINLSGQTLGESDFSSFLLDCLEKYKVPTSKICFEITESSAVSSFVDTSSFLNEMRAKGLKFALDDFGSGYCSYSYLKKLPVDTLKIDGCFVKEVLNHQFDHTMVKSITEIAHSIGLKVVAEFVENSEILEHLAEIGVDFAQGYHIDKPNPL